MKKVTYEQLVNDLDNIQGIVDKISKSPNPAVEILKILGLTEWHDLNKFYKCIMEDEDSSTISMLYNRKFADSYNKVRKAFDNVIQEQLSALGFYRNNQTLSIFIGATNKKTIRLRTDTSGELHSFYKPLLDQDPSFLDNYIENPDQYVEELQDGSIELFDCYNVMYEPISLQNDGINELFDTLTEYYRLWSKIASYKDFLDHSYSLNFYDIKDCTIADFKKYSLKNAKETHRNLRQKAQSFKEKRNLPLGPEQWGDLLAAEDDAYRLAIEGKLCQNEEERYEHIDSITREQMEENAVLLQTILNVSRDEETFDFEYADERHINLYTKLNPENLELFYDLVLRRNIIQCEIFPHIKDDHDTWLRQGTPANKNTDGSHTLEPKYELTILSDDLRNLFMKPDKFDAYCRVLNGDIKAFIDGQGNKAIWDVVNFYSMLYGFFPRNISRENAAALFVKIIPELGESKALAASMGKCDDTDKKKLKKYAALPPTDGLNAYDENIGKWIKKIS